AIEPPGRFDVSGQPPRQPVAVFGEPADAAASHAHGAEFRRHVERVRKDEDRQRDLTPDGHATSSLWPRVGGRPVAADLPDGRMAPRSEGMPMLRASSLRVTSAVCAGIALAGAFALLQGRQSQPALALGSLKLPPGFHIAVYADNVPGAREMTLG